MSKAQQPRRVCIQACGEDHVHLQIDLAHSELSTNLSDGAIRADLSLDPRDALEIAEKLFGEVWQLAQEHARRIMETEQKRRLQ
jgi:hypothetical protein